MAQVVTINGVYYLLKKDRLTLLRHHINGPSALNFSIVLVEAYATKPGFADSSVSSASYLIYNPRNQY